MKTYSKLKPNLNDPKNVINFKIKLREREKLPELPSRNNLLASLKVCRQCFCYDLELDKTCDSINMSCLKFCRAEFLRNIILMSDPDFMDYFILKKKDLIPSCFISKKQGVNL